MEDSAYVLAPHVALRSWECVPYASIERFKARPRPLSAEEFRVALACDGSTPIPSSDALGVLLERGLVVPCAPGAVELEPWQRYRHCPNRVMPWLALEITSRCNYNCIHCFNAVDNERLHAEMSFSQVEQVLDGAQAAGVNAVLLTGGEPLMHPRFLDIVAAVYERGMFVFEINTNGRFLTPELLDNIAALGYKPEIKISFDGVGYHDWMRACPGAEADALRAIKLCVSKGFPVRVQLNFNRKNRESILPSLELLDGMGVERARVIPTVPSVRWEMNAQGQCLEWEEYLAAFLEIAAAYARGQHAMELDGWRVATLYPARRAFKLAPVRYSEKTFKESRPCCAQINGMAAVAADGELYPCLQCSGWYSAHGVSFGNVFEDGFDAAIVGESYCQVAHATIADKIAHLRQPGSRGRSRSCAECRWLTWCAGGCPALGTLISNGDTLAPDPCACKFFDASWPARFAQNLSPWRCLSEIPA